MRKFLLIILFPVLVLTVEVPAQLIKKVLFLGNSYTAVNNLPQLVASVAQSMGDSVIYDSNTPGGCTFQIHLSTPASTGRISARNWDYVVLQEQSQLPSFPPSQVQTDCLPYADTLNQLIKANDSCTTTMFYMTWGRKNGDASNCASYPPICTYTGMQGRLRSSYLLMGQMFGAEVCPAGAVWKEVRTYHPLIDLYQTDESHPSMTGSYLVACSFYASIFHKPCLNSNFVPSGVTTTDALIIRQVVDSIVFDSLATWMIDTTHVRADFTYSNAGSGTYNFTNTSSNGINYFWNFGDGDSSYSANPAHTYQTPGQYNVMLIAKKHCFADTIIKNVNITTGINSNFITGHNLRNFCNPADDYLNLDKNIDMNKIVRINISSVQGTIAGNRYSIEGNRIDIRNLAPGTYLLTIIWKDGLMDIIKFVKC